MTRGYGWRNLLRLLPSLVLSGGWPRLVFAGSVATSVGAGPSFRSRARRWLPHPSRVLCGRVGHCEGRQHSHSFSPARCGWTLDLDPAFFGSSPRLVFAGSVTTSAAPRFAMFEAWALLLPASGDFPNPQLGLLRFIDQYPTSFIVSIVAEAAPRPLFRLQHQTALLPEVQPLEGSQLAQTCFRSRQRHEIGCPISIAAAPVRVRSSPGCDAGELWDDGDVSLTLPPPHFVFSTGSTKKSCDHVTNNLDRAYRKRTLELCAPSPRNTVGPKQPEPLATNLGALTPYPAIFCL